MGNTKWDFQIGIIAPNCGAKMDGETEGNDDNTDLKRCPICEAKLELEDDTPTSCDECSWASKLYRSCTCCPRYKKMKENEKEET